MTDTNVFDTDQYPALIHVHDRTNVRPQIERVFFGEASFAQAADLNEAFSREAGRRKAIGDLIAKDGDRLSGAEVIVDSASGTVKITAGVLYLVGAPRPVDEKTLTAVPMTGDVEIGVRMVLTPVTAADDNLYLGLVDGTEAYGEEGAVRTSYALEWAFDGDGGAGAFYRYLLIRDGVVVSQSAPPFLTGVQRQIAAYDFGAHGNYIVKGCEVQALGMNGSKRIFSIGAGEANINGFKVTRDYDSRIEVDQAPNVDTVPAELHTFDTAVTSVITVRHPPIAAVSAAIVTKQKTVTLLKGVSGSSDLLPDTGVTSIISVVQGGTTYVATTSYVKSADTISWAPAGPEPATNSSYSVTYRYLASVTPDLITARTVTLSGGVVGTDIFLAYSYKLPRHDLLCMTQEGFFEYLPGQASPSTPHPPAEPSNVLSLCRVENDWFDLPVIKNDGTPAITFKMQNYLNDRLRDALNLICLERLKNDAMARSPGIALGVFTDPFTDDEFRDLGEPQDAACFEGTCQIGIDPTFHSIKLPEVQMLDYGTEVVINQSLATACEKINPYQNFEPVPAKITIDPKRDFWTETDEVTHSEKTRVIGSGNKQRIKTTNVVKRIKKEKLRNLREIQIDFEISDLGAGETLVSLTFDGIDVMPLGLVANANGVISGSFEIPAGVASGVKLIRAVSGSGRACQTRFRGQGKIETTITRETTIFERFRDDPPVPPARSWPFGHGSDPQAQSFVLQRGGHVAKVEFKFCRIGDKDKPVIVQIVTVGDQGFPTQQVLGTADLDMNTVLANSWTSIPFEVPTYIPADTYDALVIKTDDALHSIAIARLGAFEPSTQKWVTAQPYIAGDRFSGSNSLSWLLHPDSDITYRLHVCRFTQNQKIVELGTISVSEVSDIMIQASVILPEAATSVVFRVTLGGVVYSILPDQNLELTEFYTGNVKLQAVLTGTEYASPILAQDILVVLGKMRPTGTYVGQAFTMGASVRVDGVMSTWLPNGSTLTVELDAGDDTWLSMPLVESTPIDEGFVEKTFRRNPHVAPNGGRVRIHLTGTPAARPALADLRLFTN